MHTEVSRQLSATSAESLVEKKHFYQKFCNIVSLKPIQINRTIPIPVSLLLGMNFYHFIYIFLMSIYKSKSCTGKDDHIESLLLTSNSSCPCYSWLPWLLTRGEAALSPISPQEQRITPEKLAFTPLFIFYFFSLSAFPAKTNCCICSYKEAEVEQDSLQAWSPAERDIV